MPSAAVCWLLPRTAMPCGCAAIQPCQTEVVLREGTRRRREATHRSYSTFLLTTSVGCSSMGSAVDALRPAAEVTMR